MTIPKLDTGPFTYAGRRKLALARVKTDVQKIYDDKRHYKKLIRDFRDALHEQQEMMYAHDRHSMLLVFQAMDAAGKDGTIENVIRGVNPHGIRVDSFKKPSAEELDHNFLWRTNRVMPRRGTIGIFNRSHYEEVLVARVHPEIVTRYQRLPAEATKNLTQLWKKRYRAINDMERTASENGTVILKFFLNVSKDEQKRRFLSRIEEPEKNWKFSEADLEERGYWDAYMDAYQKCVNATSSAYAPWFVIPADDKKNMRLIVSRIILDHLEKMKMHYPKVTAKRRSELQEYRKRLMNEGN